MRTLTAFLLTALFSVSVFAESTSLLRYDGGEIETPYWFKESFLDIEDDLAEAEEEDKRLMLYFHQAGCPYCYNMVQQNFLDPQLSAFIQEKFDVLALDLWGDREVTLSDGEAFTEKDLAAKLKIQYTPTLIFLNRDGSVQLRIDGYRPKPVFSQILDYVLSGQTEGGLAHQLIQKSSDSTLYPQPFILQTRDLSSLKGKPVAVLLEYPGCEDCDAMHRHAIARKSVHTEFEKFAVVRFDVTETQPLMLPSGVVTTPSKWVKELGITYYPSIVLLDAEGAEQHRIGGYVQSFHLATSLEYVSAKGYSKFPEFQRFLNDRADRLREAGEKVVITE